MLTKRALELAMIKRDLEDVQKVLATLLEDLAKMVGFNSETTKGVTQVMVHLLVLDARLRFVEESLGIKPKSPEPPPELKKALEGYG